MSSPGRAYPSAIHNWADVWQWRRRSAVANDDGTDIKTSSSHSRRRVLMLFILSCAVCCVVWWSIGSRCCRCSSTEIPCSFRTAMWQWRVLFDCIKVIGRYTYCNVTLLLACCVGAQAGEPNLMGRWEIDSKKALFYDTKTPNRTALLSI